jgi:DNA-binding NtrC family response regulator
MTVLHVDDDPIYTALVARLLATRGDPALEIRSVATASEALRAVSRARPALVLLDYRLPDAEGLEVLAALRAAHPTLPVVLLTVMTAPQIIVGAVRAGATDYVIKDDTLASVLPRIVRELLERHDWNPAAADPQLAQRPPSAATDRAAATDPLAALVGSSQAMAQIRRSVRMAASSPLPVLIEGETGTGKELVARAIHAASARAGRPLVPVNCAAIPEALAESELFGHARGAFTGAYREKDGLFEAARGGTLFLDEIEDLPLALQAKLLRVLQDFEYRPVGTNTPRRADVRVVAASNQSPVRLVQEGRLRPDLYYRLRVLSIVVPPLRLRREDIPALASHFVQRFEQRLEHELGPLPAPFLARLCRAPWPGNARELENTMEALCAAAHAARRSIAATVAELPRGSICPGPLDERSALLHTLESYRWSRQAAARALGISRVTLWRRMVRLGIRDGGGSQRQD